MIPPDTYLLYSTMVPTFFTLTELLYFDLAKKTLRTQLGDARDTFTKLAERNSQHMDVNNNKCICM